MSGPKSIKQIVLEYLQKHGYDGLCNVKFSCCTCAIDGDSANFRRPSKEKPMDFMGMDYCDEESEGCVANCVPWRRTKLQKEGRE